MWFGRKAQSEENKFLGTWKLLSMIANDRYVIDAEDPNEKRVVFYGFEQKGSFTMQMDQKSTLGNWSIETPNDIRLDMSRAGGLFVGIYFFMDDPFYDHKLVLKGRIGKDDMHIVLVK